jgi:hypothetical protein
MDGLRRTNIILNDILRGLSQADAVAHRDGPDGWNVLEIVCHLRDLEDIYRRRAEQMVAEDNPAVLPFDVPGAVIANDYAHADLAEALSAWNERRAAYLAYLSGLTTQQWERTGVHPAYGPYTVLDAALRTTLHDVNHTEQVLKALRRAV